MESNQFLSKPKTLDYTGSQIDHKNLDCTFIFSQSSNLGEEMNSRYHYIYLEIFFGFLTMLKTGYLYN